ALTPDDSDSESETMGTSCQTRRARDLSGGAGSSPWYAKALAICVAGYALSPVDLIPDFVPVLGYLDDVIIVPLGIMLVVRLIPPEIMAEHRELAAAAQDRPVSRSAAIVIATVWAACIALVGWLRYSLSSS